MVIDADLEAMRYIYPGKSYGERCVEVICHEGIHLFLYDMLYFQPCFANGCDVEVYLDLIGTGSHGLLWEWPARAIQDRCCEDVWNDFDLFIDASRIWNE